MHCFIIYKHDMMLLVNELTLTIAFIVFVCIFHNFTHCSYDSVTITV